LEQYPDDALVYAYDGEITGIIVVDPTTKAQIGVIHAAEDPRTHEASQ
jgi:hypothetical protein